MTAGCFWPFSKVSHAQNGQLVSTLLGMTLSLRSPLSADAAALRAITFYQRHISPRKGFRCACGALHGGETCSAAVSRIIRTQGLRAGLPAIQAQFGRCRAAHNAIKRGATLANPAQAQAGQVQGLFCCGPIPIPFRCG